MEIPYFNARFYDSTIGRFISADTIVPDPFSSQSYNRYMFVNGNPIMYVDPTGHYGDYSNPGAPPTHWEPTPTSTPSSSSRSGSRPVKDVIDPVVVQEILGNLTFQMPMDVRDQLKEIENPAERGRLIALHGQPGIPEKTTKKTPLLPSPTPGNKSKSIVKTPIEDLNENLQQVIDNPSEWRVYAGSTELSGIGPYGPLRHDYIGYENIYHPDKNFTYTFYAAGNFLYGDGEHKFNAEWGAFDSGKNIKLLSEPADTYAAKNLTIVNTEYKYMVSAAFAKPGIFKNNTMQDNLGVAGIYVYNIFHPIKAVTNGVAVIILEGENCQTIVNKITR